MNIHTYGSDSRVKVCAALLAEHGASAFSGGAVLLPIPTTVDNKYIKGTDVPIEKVYDDVGTDTLVVGYALPRRFREEIGARGGYVCDLSCDEDFLLRNAVLTAEGTVGYLLTTSSRAPGDLVIGIIGYGRIGRELVRLFMFLGASVRVYTTKESTRVELGRCGVQTCFISDGSAHDFSGLDILINTAPAAVIGEGDVSALSGGVRVIELASGKNIPENIKSERLPSVPSAMYPDSAGRAYYSSVMRMSMSAGGIK